MTDSASVTGPGATLGILGGGQLGRMLAMAAARLGYRVHVLTPEPDSPAAQVANVTHVADYEDPQALAALADACAVITAEFENVPAEAARWLAERRPVRPGPGVLAVAQDRLAEKDFCRAHGLATAPYARVASRAELESALETVGRPAILKTIRLGYDGKGQHRLGPDSDPATVWAAHVANSGEDSPAILEGHVSFVAEVSVLVARTPMGALAAFPPVRNEHRDGILHTTTWPAGLSPAVGAAALATAERLAVALDLAGLLAVEMFVTAEGSVLVNEMAPRPHNSGHWTLDACWPDQFEQTIRAVCNLPLLPPRPLASARMTNLMGDDATQWAALLADPTARLHLYGKGESRPGRKMGHVTRLLASPSGGTFP